MNDIDTKWIIYGENDLSTIQDLAFKFPFELDKFQKEAIVGIENNHNVLVCVGTGSGKTAIAQYAIGLSLKRNKRIIYTSPIKSLSNQKFDEFKKIFPDLGILTGDIKFNPYAQCVIMTTEILRNMLYKKDSDNKLEIDIIDANKLLKDVDCVIFDEVHYINDHGRGKVWEESIMMLNREINLVMLSATIKNPHKFAEWIGNIKQKNINLIIKEERVIPLTHYYYIDDRMIKSLYKVPKNNQNIELLDDNRLIEILDSKNNFKQNNYEKVKKIYNYMEQYGKYINYKSIMDSFIDYLMLNGLTPALFFCFSRKNVEQFAKNISINIVVKEEREQIIKIFNDKMASLNSNYENTSQYHFIKGLLLKGIAIHHSGLIPILKEIIEILFAKGLIKILFATETFAVGVNMPTKTVVFTEIEKYDGLIGGTRILRTDEYQQMAGRAGRRGLDKIGTVIHLGIREYQPNIVMKNMMTGRMPEIKSKFTLSYQYILKIINFKNDMQNIMDFIKCSLMEKENSIYIKYNQDELNDEMNKLNMVYEDNLTGEELEKINKYNKIKSSEYAIKGNKLKKQMNELENDINFMNKLNNYNNMMDIKNKIKDIEYQIDQCTNSSQQMVYIILDYLQKYGYVKYDNYELVNKTHITIKGLIAMEINECNELIFTEIIYNGMIDHLEPKEIVAVLAIFIEERVKEEIYSIESLNISKNVIDFLFDINKIVEHMSYDEYDNWIDIGTDWNLHLSFILPAYKWANGDNIKDICTCYMIYEGNFIRNIIKINKICQDILKICEITKNDKLKKKVEQIEPLLLRDIVTIESLYI